jgi:hypothetical protein
LQLPHVCAELSLFAPVGPSGADDPDLVILSFGPHDENQAAADWSDGDETLFIQRMGIVEELEMLHAGRKKLTGLAE